VYHRSCIDPLIRLAKFGPPTPRDQRLINNGLASHHRPIDRNLLPAGHDKDVIDLDFSSGRVHLPPVNHNEGAKGGHFKDLSDPCSSSVRHILFKEHT
jgi:hypothetical protein